MHACIPKKYKKSIELAGGFYVRAQQVSSKRLLLVNVYM